MLPFLKPKVVAGLIIRKRQPDGQTPESHSEEDGDPAVEAAAEDLIKCVHAKDVKGVAAALQAAFEILDSMPHEEGPHPSDEETE